LTALLDAHELPASTVTDELGEGDDDVEPLPLGAVELVAPLLHAASPVTAATAATMATAIPGRRAAPGLDVSVLRPDVSVLNGLIGICSFAFSSVARPPWRGGVTAL
jgi:hypothetical protein